MGYGGNFLQKLSPVGAFLGKWGPFAHMRLFGEIRKVAEIMICALTDGLTNFPLVQTLRAYCPRWVAITSDPLLDRGYSSGHAVGRGEGCKSVTLSYSGLPGPPRPQLA
jgi:hypothetical protein